MPRSIAIAAAFLLLSGQCVSAQSRWVGLGPNGKLVYSHLNTGDSIPDYSSAGYKGGGVAIPNVPTRTKVIPSGADDTAAIQAAIDAVSKLPLIDGIRGAVELAPGIFQCSGTIQLKASGAQARQQGPVVVLHNVFHGNGHIEPHQRWSTGLLIDSGAVPEGGIDLMNRGTMGSGHGWAMGWGVSWNNTAGEFTIQQAPGTMTWSIGDIGPQHQQPMPVSGGQKGPNLPGGQIDSAGKHVLPRSIYLEQLYERLGPEALTNIGYDPSSR